MWSFWRTENMTQWHKKNLVTLWNNKIGSNKGPRHFLINQLCLHFSSLQSWTFLLPTACSQNQSTFFDSILYCHLSLFPLLFDWQLLAAAQFSACIRKLCLELSDAVVKSGTVLAALSQLFIGPIQQLLKLRCPAAVIVGIYRAIGKSL